MLTDRQRKALDWVLICAIETTAEKAHGYEPHQAIEEIDDLGALAELLGNPMHKAWVAQTRAEHEPRVAAATTRPSYEDLLQRLDDVSAIASNLCPADYDRRTKQAIHETRELCHALLRADDRDEDEEDAA